MNRRIDPFLAAVLAAVLSCGTLALAVMFSWLGTNVGEGLLFCEALRDSHVIAPANTWSNLGFVVAGLAIGWQVRKDATVMNGLGTFFAVMVVLLGPASAAMHATGTTLGKHFDLTSMFLISSFGTAYALTRWLGKERRFFYAMFFGMLVFSEGVYLFGPTIPVVLHAGNLMFAIGILITLTLETLLCRRMAEGPRKTAVIRAAIAAVASLGFAFFVWNLDQNGWCRPYSLIQGHAIWHIFCAVAAYQLFRLYRASDARVGSSGATITMAP
jgi:predicted membrane channel-forming protein YqfA (hemolysin III family)